ARPWAARAMRSAVAGATTTRSADWPIRTWGTSWASLQTSVLTGLPDSAAHVAAPTNCRAAAVGTTVTSWPLSVKRRSSSQALYAAMPPATPRTTEGRDPVPSGTSVAATFVMVGRGSAVGREAGFEGGGLLGLLLGGEL